uniref:Uncharacterized protein n=1 Tax=Romanomermis culicivorax TaxID=13658 RepID=A0A915KGI7_ROMCU
MLHRACQHLLLPEQKSAPPLAITSKMIYIRAHFSSLSELIYSARNRTARSSAGVEDDWDISSKITLARLENAIIANA